MKPLYEITEDHKDLLKLADENEDIEKAVADTMELIEGDFNDKAISLIHVVNSMSDDAVILDNEIKRLTKRKKSIESKQDSMKDYLRVNMEATGINKIQCPLFTITLRKGRDIVNIIDESAIPADFLDIKTTMTPMKKEILAALKEGCDVSGTNIIKSKSSISIK